MTIFVKRSSDQPAERSIRISLLCPIRGFLLSTFCLSTSQFTSQFGSSCSSPFSILIMKIFYGLALILKSHLSKLKVVISPFFTSSNVGLFLSTVGSVVIAKAVITTIPGVMSTAHGRWGGHSSIAYLYASLAKKEAVVGVIYLLLGFVLQVQVFRKIQVKSSLIITIFALLFFAASFEVLPFLSARDTLRDFLVSIKDKNTDVRSIAEDFKSVGIRNDIIEDILKVQNKYKHPSRENFPDNPSFAEEHNRTVIMIRSEEWELVKKLASSWHIEIDPNNVMERQ